VKKKIIREIDPQILERLTKLGPRGYNEKFRKKAKILPIDN